MRAFGVTFASNSARLIGGVAGFCAYTAQHDPRHADDQQSKRCDLEGCVQRWSLFPPFPDRAAAFGAVRGAVGFRVHTTPDRDDRASKDEGDGQYLEDGFHSLAPSLARRFKFYIGIDFASLSLLGKKLLRTDLLAVGRFVRPVECFLSRVVPLGRAFTAFERQVAPC